MVSLTDYLPAIPTQYWSHYLKLVVPPKVIVVPPNTSDIGILPASIADRKGLFVQFSISVNNPALEFTITIDGINHTGVLSTIKDAGLVGYYVPNVPWLSVYNTTNNIYVANLIADPFIPFNSDLNVTVANPTTSSITITGMAAEAYILNPGFYEALKKVMS